jgi:hypothetical protein
MSSAPVSLLAYLAGAGFILYLMVRPVFDLAG